MGIFHHDNDDVMMATSRELYISQVICNFNETRMCKAYRFNTENATLTLTSCPARHAAATFSGVILAERHQRGKDIPDFLVMT